MSRLILESVILFLFFIYKALQFQLNDSVHIFFYVYSFDLCVQLVVCYVANNEKRPVIPFITEDEMKEFLTDIYNMGF